MITILTFAIIGIAISIYNTRQNDWGMDFIDYFGATLIGVALGGFLGFFVALSLPAKFYTAHTIKKLENLQDGNSTKGSFYLGVGQIEGKMRYVFYVEENGLYRMNQIDYNLAAIKYTNSIAKVHFYEERKTSDIINYFALDFRCDDNYILEVPNGTIKNTYNLDAQ